MDLQTLSAWFAGVVFGAAIVVLCRWHWLDWRLRRMYGQTGETRVSYRATLQDSSESEDVQGTAADWAEYTLDKDR